MLVDSHCHLDFPDFASELDAVVARAEAAGVGRIVTISTRVRRHAQVLAIAERFPNVTCSVGTHPHHAHEELDVTANDLIARAKHPKVVAIGEAVELSVSNVDACFKYVRPIDSSNQIAYLIRIVDAALREIVDIDADRTVRQD